MTIPTHLQQQLEQIGYDFEELLLQLYFQLKEQTKYFHRRFLVHDYNTLVEIINEQDPCKHYKFLVA